MELGFTEDEQAIREGVRQIMSTEASQDKLIDLHGAATGHLPALWDALRDGGWLGILIPEEYAGVGASLTEAAAVFEEYGSGPLPQLYVVASSLAPALVAELGTEKQKQELLPAIAGGELRATVAVTEEGASWSATHLATTLTRTGSGFRLNGTKTPVIDALGATHALVAARDADSAAVCVVLVDLTSEGVARELLEGFTSWETQVSFTDVDIPEGAVLGEGEDGREGLMRAIRAAIPVVSAYQVGSAHAAYQLALEHSRTRIAFGQPIGRFQRVQDHVIEALNHVDSARWLTYEAIWKAENGKSGADTALHLAKAVTAKSHWEACNASHEVHAGIGADMRYGLAKHTYLSHAMYHFLGGPGWHRERLAESLGW